MLNLRDGANYVVRPRSSCSSFSDRGDRIDHMETINRCGRCDRWTIFVRITAIVTIIWKPGFKLPKISKTITLHVHHAFLYISFPVTARLRRELPTRFHVLSTTWTYGDEFLLLFLNLNIFLKNSTPGEFAYLKHSDGVVIIALKFHSSRSHFLSDVFCSRRRQGVLHSLIMHCLTVTLWRQCPLRDLAGNGFIVRCHVTSK